MSRIAVVGGNGQIARLLHPLLVERGHTPVAQDRTHTVGAGDSLQGLAQRTAPDDQALEGDALVAHQCAGIDEVGEALHLDHAADAQDQRRLHRRAAGGEVAEVERAVDHVQWLGLRIREAPTDQRAVVLGDGLGESRFAQLHRQAVVLEEEVVRPRGEAEGESRQPRAEPGRGGRIGRPRRVDVGDAVRAQGRDEVGGQGHGGEALGQRQPGAGEAAAEVGHRPPHPARVAKREAREQMLSVNNLLLPSNGEPVVAPTPTSVLTPSSPTTPSARTRRHSGSPTRTPTRSRKRRSIRFRGSRTTSSARCGSNPSGVGPFDPPRSGQ